jgi:hypothetical protein
MKQKKIAIGVGVIALGSLVLNVAACGLSGSSAEGGGSGIGHASQAVTSPPPTQTATAPATVTATASATATADASSPADGGDAGGDGGASTTVGKVFVVPRLRCACWGPNNPDFGDIAEVDGFSVCAASVEACDSRELRPNPRDIACRAICVDQGKKNGRNYNTGMETSQFEYELGDGVRPSCTAVDPELRCALPR